MTDEHKRHLGDGVYANLDFHGRTVLTTENGLEVTNIVVLEPEVWRALEKWIEELR